MTLALPPGSLALQPLSRIRQEENCQVEILFGRALWKSFKAFLAFFEIGQILRNAMNSLIQLIIFCIGCSVKRFTECKSQCSDCLQRR